MRAKVARAVIELVLGDITKQSIQAIGNAANAALVGGGGVDGAIHSAGGPAIMKELRERYQGCPTGSAVITGAGDLKAEFVIHAVGPRYRGRPEDAELLASAYRRSLDLCLDHSIEAVAFPSISTGIYGYPLHEAASIALRAVADHLEAHAKPSLVRFVLFGPRNLDAYENALEELARKGRVRGLDRSP